MVVIITRGPWPCARGHKADSQPHDAHMGARISRRARGEKAKGHAAEGQRQTQWPAMLRWRAGRHSSSAEPGLGSVRAPPSAMPVWAYPSTRVGLPALPTALGTEAAGLAPTSPRPAPPPHSRLHCSCPAAGHRFRLSTPSPPSAAQPRLDRQPRTGHPRRKAANPRGPRA